jgi:tetratricopeptide (TPR) repeat protein
MTQQIFIVALAALILAGCASTPSGSGVKEDKSAQVRSQAFIEGTSYVLAGESRATCAIPAGAEKVQIRKDAGPSKDWKDLVARANGCVADKNWATLDQLAALIARNDLDSPWGAYFYSVAAEANGDFSRAIWMAELAQKKAGGRTGLFFYQRGHVLLSMKETVKAMADFEKGLSLDPSLLDGQLFLGEIYHRDQQLDQAAKYYGGALALDGKNYRALTGLAEVKLRQGDGAKAVEYYQKATASHPKEMQPWVRLAYIYETVQKSPEQALATYKTLKSGLDGGSLKGQRPELDLNAKIKTLEQAVAPRVPAQANAQPAVTPKATKK